MSIENPPLLLSATDYHTAGEPFRIVSGGVGPILGESVLDKRAWAIENLDRVRRFLVYEPRGHADMYGCFVTEADDGDADLGVLFFHNAGFSTACGHGTIALATWAIESGIVSPSEPETEMVIDVPSGRLPVTAKVEAGRPVSVRFRNVPSFVHSRGLSVGTRSAGEERGLVGRRHASNKTTEGPDSLPNPSNDASERSASVGKTSVAGRRAASSATTHLLLRGHGQLVGPVVPGLVRAPTLGVTLDLPPSHFLVALCRFQEPLP